LQALMTAGDDNPPIRITNIPRWVYSSSSSGDKATAIGNQATKGREIRLSRAQSNERACICDLSLPCHGMMIGLGWEVPVDIGIQCSKPMWMRRSSHPTGHGRPRKQTEKPSTAHHAMRVIIARGVRIQSRVQQQDKRARIQSERARTFGTMMKGGSHRG
jgi:hypothetical protein